jgi:hypothetical protein
MTELCYECEKHLKVDKVTGKFYCGNKSCKKYEQVEEEEDKKPIKFHFQPVGTYNPFEH